MTNFDITIISDTVCPWCYVGKNKLEAGIKAYQAAVGGGAADTFTTRWMPFYLNPSAPSPGVDKQTMYESRFGRERTAMIQQRLSAEGAKVGIDFRYGGKTGNTRDSHRLIRFAGLQDASAGDVQNRLVAELFAAYFEREQDITSHDVLLDAAQAAGLDRVECAAYLAGSAGGAEVDAEVADAQAANLVSGVPNFVINGKYEIQGAQDADGFRRVFEKIKERDG